MTQPIISWFESSNAMDSEVKDIVSYGTVDADSDSTQKTFFIWNNRNGESDVSKMEEVTFTTRDRQGGVGDTPGSEVEAVRDNWFRVRVDSLDETTFIPVGKGGIVENQEGVKPVGTTGSTKNPNADNAIEWEENSTLDEGVYIKPTTDNGFIYKVVKEGTTGGTEPTWSMTDGNIVIDGTVEYVTIPIERTPASQEILGVANSVEADGSNAEDAEGNFIKITVYAEVPITASAGINKLQKRISYRYV